ncbi:MAG: DNA polymerase III subunit delta [Prevotella sp.]|nr:DNA polymerase III subunit delta [Prevotella sp.]
MKFSGVIGQEDIKRRLVQMAEEDRIPHALMLCGNTGCGTLALAFAFASYVLGEREEGTNPHVEAMLQTLQHPDLHFIYPVIRPPKTPSDRKITSDDYIRQWQKLLSETPYFNFEEWLGRMKADNQQAIIFAAEGDILAHKMSFKSSQGGYKAVIIWLPERMHPAFANKILKLLEEPPSQTLFLLVSEEPQAILETIRSRVQRIDIKRIDDEAMAGALMSKRGIEQAVAVQVARVVHGDWLRAVEVLDSENEKREFLEYFMSIMRTAYKRDTKAMKKWTETVSGLGREKQRRFLTYVAEQFRENFIYNFSCKQLNYMTAAEESFSRNFARFINEANVRDMLRLTDRTMAAIGQNANPKMQFFDFALQITVFLRRK